MKRRDNPAILSSPGEIPSGPVALFDFSRSSFFSTSLYDNRASYMHGIGFSFTCLGACCGSIVFANFSPIVEKKLFIRLAFSLSSTARLLSSRFNGPIDFQAFGFVALGPVVQSRIKLI